jgi:hypothetical protein
MKLIENSVLYAAKLNESSQWLHRPEEVVDIHSEYFKNVLLDNVKDKNLGKVRLNSRYISIIAIF